MEIDLIALLCELLSNNSLFVCQLFDDKSLACEVRWSAVAQWRMLDSRPRGRGFEPHRRHCMVVLEQDTFILA